MVQKICNILVCFILYNKNLFYYIMKKILILIIILFIIFLNYRKDNYEFLNNNYISYVLYIPERYEYIKNIISKLNINAKYIKGYNNKDYNLNTLLENNIVSKKWISDTNNKKPYIKPYNLERVLCHLGHIKILKEFLNTNESYTLIFEDDILIQNDFKNLKNKIDHIINNIPKDAEIIYFSYCFEYCNKIKKYNEIFYKAYRPLCRHFYLVNKKGAKKIIENTIPMISSGDRMIGNLIKLGVLNGYLVDPKYLYIKQNRNNTYNFNSKLKNYRSHKLCM